MKLKTASKSGVAALILLNSGQRVATVRNELLLGRPGLSRELLPGLSFEPEADRGRVEEEAYRAMTAFPPQDARW